MAQFHQTATAVSLLLLFSSVSAYPAVMMGIPDVDAANRNIFLDGRLSGWNSTTNPNPSITVVNGDAVTLSLSSSDAPHLFYIDINGNSAHDCPQEKCSDEFPPDTSFPFTVNFAPGTYTYYCRYHQGPMHGSFLVQGFTIDSTQSSLRVVQGSSNTSTITVTSVNGFSGVVGLSAPISPSGPVTALSRMSVTLFPGGIETSTLTVSTTGSTALGGYVVDVTGTSGSAFSTRSIATTVVAPDFGISAGPTTLAIPLGSARSSTITLSSLDSFSGNVDLSMSPLPSGITAAFSPNPVTLPSGGTATSMLDVTVSSATALGTYTVDVIGTSGFLAHTATITVVAGPDFSISANPAALTLTANSSGTSTLTLTSFNSFAGTVILTGAVSPGGLIFSFSPQSVPLPSDGSATAVLAVNASATTAAGPYAVTVTATGGPTVHPVPIAVSVTDFSITASNPNLILQQGSSVTTTVSIASINGFVGEVNLAITASTNALSQLLNVTTLSLNPSGPGFATLTVNASSAPAGTYTVSITGTSGSLARSISMSVTVQPSQGGASILPLVGGIAVGAIAITMASTYLIRRGKLRRKATSQSGPKVTS